MKQIEGRATRVQKYDRMFFWYVPSGAIFLAVLALLGFPQAWPQIGLGLFAGLMLGIVAGVLLRDAP